jgi:nitrite reductase/ring-hydroxylating ferredoxin subunit
MQRQRLASLEALQQHGTIKFTYLDEGISREGFLACVEGQVVCYENVCRHIPITLDYGDGRFFTPDGKFFICQTHGATYEPLTGKCVAGPCPGTFLKKLAVTCEQGQVFLVR